MTTKIPKFTKPVKRGFIHVLTAIASDTDYAILDPTSPWLRTMKGQDRTDFTKALEWIMAHVTALQETEQTPTPTNPETPAPEPANEAVPSNDQGN